jgi:uncharacterized protein (TIGR03437 family)
MTFKTALILLVSAWPAMVWSQTANGLKERAKPYLATALAAGDAFVTVSSASGMPNLSPDALVTAFGSNLAPATAPATPPYPMSLGGISVQVVDSTGVMRMAQLLYVSPSQINYLLPAGTAKGMTTVNIVDATGSMKTASAPTQTVAPALFTANENGMGVAAATAYRTVIPTNITSPVEVFQCGTAPDSCVSVPINPGVDAPVTITFYATGLRGRSSDSAVTLTIGGQSIPIRSITAQDDTSAGAGVDLVTIGLPLSLRGAGEVDVVLQVDGAFSNAAKINIQ